MYVLPRGAGWPSLSISERGTASLRAAAVDYGAPAAAVVLVAAANWLITKGHTSVAFVLCLALPVVFVAVWAGLAALAGVLLLLILNGVPGLNLASLNVHGSFEAMDVCAMTLIALAVVRYFTRSPTVDSRPSPYVKVWSALFTAVWLWAFMKGLDRGVPALKAALFGRDFLFFALLVPTAAALVKSERDLTRFLIVVGAATAVFALAEVAVSVGALQATVVNARQTLKVGPVTRVYSPMNDLVALGFACSLAYALLHSGKRARWAALMACICGTAVVLQLTRALYIGMIVGIVCGLAVWARGRGLPHVALRKRLISGVLVAAVLMFVVAAVAPQIVSSSSVQTITNRVSEGVSDVGRSNRFVTGNTVAYRQKVGSEMLRILGPHWLSGLGFLHPATIYFPQFPHGSIRDNDLGLLNGVMTMGVIGTVLVYVPVLMGLLRARPRDTREKRWDWLRLGATIWMLAVIAGSLTLVTLFSPNGLVLMAIVLGLVSRVARPSHDLSP